MRQVRIHPNLTSWQRAAKWLLIFRAMIEFQQQVRRDAHHMLSFVRFRELKSELRFGAWFRPDHGITRRIAPSSAFPRHALIDPAP